VRDLALLVDKLDPDARVDAQVVSVAAGRTAVFSVRTAAELDPEELVGPRVLRTANALVAADRRAATQGR
jgi:beta-mannosidase